MPLSGSAILFQHSFPSLREVENAGPTTLAVELRNDGEVFFSWSAKGVQIESVQFCASAFCDMVASIPAWFTEIGKPVFYDSCDLPSMMVCVHDEEYPQVIIGVIRKGGELPVSVAVLERGVLLSMLDEINYQMAEIENFDVCETDEPEDIEIPTGDDPFFNLDLSVRH